MRWAEAGRSCGGGSSSSRGEGLLVEGGGRSPHGGSACKRRSVLLPVSCIEASGCRRTDAGAARAGDGGSGGGASGAVDLETLSDAAAELLEANVAKELVESKRLLVAKRHEVNGFRV